MKPLHRLAICIAAVAVVTLEVRATASEGNEKWAEFIVSGGTASFHVATNVQAITVHGKSTALKGHAWVRQDPHGFGLRGLEAIVPVVSVTTGLVLRDKHMRSHIFTTDAGEMPDLRFSAGEATCSPGKPGEQTCVFAGELTIRDTSRPFALTAKLSQDDGVFRAVAEGALRLSDYGIERPSQLGVVAEDIVRLHFVLVSTPSPREGRVNVRSARAR